VFTVSVTVWNGVTVQKPVNVMATVLCEREAGIQE
jgi:hypothetical protein